MAFECDSSNSGRTGLLAPWELLAVLVKVRALVPFSLPDGKKKGPTLLKDELQMGPRGSIFAFLFVREGGKKSVPRSKPLDKLDKKQRRGQCGHFCPYRLHPSYSSLGLPAAVTSTLQ